MKGLLKNNFYAALPNVKWFAVLLAAFGAFAVAMDNDLPTLVIGYMLLSIVGLSLTSLASLRRESGSKWAKYKLTTPVKRSEIVKSQYLSLLCWLAAGVVIAALGMSLSIALHGMPFDRNTDILMLFTTGVSVSLFMGAAFFPLFFLGGEERSEVVMIASLLAAASVFMGLVTAVNIVFDYKLTLQETVTGAAAINAAAAAVFGLSYPLAVGIFRRKEY